MGAGMFDRILIANRGEIACRVIRTARRLGIETVAVYSDADADSLHVTSADQAIHIGPAPARESYLRGEAILAAARSTGAAAIHPGYGFLSENAAFAEACEQAGIVFIGPPASAIHAMGSKANSKTLMAEASVPLTPGYHGAEQDPVYLKAEAGRIGYPVLIKASAGGGGKGMRLLENADTFEEALASCQREAAASFGDDRVLIERFVTRPRHIEMQVFADGHGNAVHLFERDCSVQWRHQKVVEEATAPGMSDDMRARMGEAAVAAAQAVGYRGAGTVEFVAETRPDGAPGEFFFMEMNTRLQVEHPVTEAITDLDLVEWQLRVASGEPLPLSQAEIRASGHAIEVRLYAEDPDTGFLPSTGRLTRLRFPLAENGVRVDTGVREGDVISPHYDPMIAKLIVYGDDRWVALRRLIRALQDTEVAGITSNRDFLIRVLSHDEFQAGGVDTGFIESCSGDLLPPRQIDTAVLGLATLAVLQGVASDSRDASGRSDDPYSPWATATGWRPNDEDPIDVHLRDGGGEYHVQARYSGGNWRCCYGEASFTIEPVSSTRSGIAARIGDVRVRAGYDRTSDRITLILPERTAVFERIDPLALAAGADRIEHAVTAPMPGKLTALLVVPGDAVAAGQSLMVLEAMKMEHTIKAPTNGVVAALPFDTGDQVPEGAMLIRFEDEA